jgi:hypothetical protein
MNMKSIATKLALTGLVLLGACARMDHLGKPPTLSETSESPEHVAMLGRACRQRSRTSAQWTALPCGAARRTHCWGIVVP